MKAATINNAPQHLKTKLEEDFERVRNYDKLSDTEKAQLGGDMQQEMFVIKIHDQSLMLYNPVRLHPQMVHWIAQHGKVNYIISGSSSHTNHLPDAVSAFPDAKIVCSSVADAKCQAVGMRPADYLYDMRRDDTPSKKKVVQGTFDDLCDTLDGQATFFHIKGDVCTQALFVLVHAHLFEVDLLYSSSNDGWKDNQFETGASILHSKGRIFFYSMITESSKPFGYKIPFYRCLMMDPSSVLASRIMLEPPNKDGSSCLEMAKSIKTSLVQLSQPGMCERAHSVHAGSMSMQEFSEIMNQTWGWLDQISSH